MFLIQYQTSSWQHNNNRSPQPSTAWGVKPHFEAPTHVFEKSGAQASNLCYDLRLKNAKPEWLWGVEPHFEAWAHVFPKSGAQASNLLQIWGLKAQSQTHLRLKTKAGVSPSLKKKRTSVQRCTGVYWGLKSSSQFTSEKRYSGLKWKVQSSPQFTLPRKVYWGLKSDCQFTSEKRFLGVNWGIEKKRPKPMYLLTNTSLQALATACKKRQLAQRLIRNLSKESRIDWFAAVWMMKLLQQLWT